jgi:hypothetical protein
MIRLVVGQRAGEGDRLARVPAWVVLGLPYPRLRDGPNRAAPKSHDDGHNKGRVPVVNNDDRVSIELDDKPRPGRTQLPQGRLFYWPIHPHIGHPQVVLELPPGPRKAHCVPNQPRIRPRAGSRNRRRLRCRRRRRGRCLWRCRARRRFVSHELWRRRAVRARPLGGPAVVVNPRAGHSPAPHSPGAHRALRPHAHSATTTGAPISPRRNALRSSGPQPTAIMARSACW